MIGAASPALQQLLYYYSVLGMRRLQYELLVARSGNSAIDVRFSPKSGRICAGLEYSFTHLLGALGGIFGSTSDGAIHKIIIIRVIRTSIRRTSTLYPLRIAAHTVVHGYQASHDERWTYMRVNHGHIREENWRVEYSVTLCFFLFFNYFIFIEKKKQPGRPKL